jgi:hypothetical protein
MLRGQSTCSNSSLDATPTVLGDSMVLRRYARSVDGTIPAQALLYNDEEIHASQDGVGIYDGYVHELSS